MTDERIRSIVPMFGGATAYVETLDRILAYVSASEPPHESLIAWHREQFENVNARESIERRLTYLENVGFIERSDDLWMLSWAGHRYFGEKRREVLFDIMAERNIGLQSVLFELVDDPMTIEEVNEFLLAAHDELDWDPANTDMTKQRLNWLRSMGLLKRDEEYYRLTVIGREFTTDVETIRSIWMPEESFRAGSQASSTGFHAGEYQITTSGRVIDPEFRAVVLQRFNESCPVSAVDHPRLLDVAHVLSWSEYPDHRADLSNVLTLSKTHHAAFDAGLFTLDADYQLHVAPSFETGSDSLRKTLVDQEGKRVSMPERAHVAPEFLEQHNQQLEWWPG